MTKITLILIGITMMLALPQALLAADAAAGKTKAQGCTGCHANNLGGKGEAYLAEQMKAIRAGEQSHPPVLSGLSDQDIDDIAAYMNGTQ